MTTTDSRTDDQHKPAPSGLTFGFATVADVEDVVDLVHSAYHGDSSRQGWTTEADLLGGGRTTPEQVKAMVDGGHSEVLVARSGGDLVACCELDHRVADNQVYLGMFAVVPTLQAGGIGRAVLAEAERLARDHWHATEMIMKVLDARTELIDWYGRRGYVTTGQTSPFPAVDERFGTPLRDDLRFVTMVKPIRVLTRWEGSGDGHSQWYIDRFRAMADEGADLSGEARMINAMVPLGSRILDAGCGPGRVGGFLHQMGHQVVGVDVDPALIAAAEVDHPGPRWMVGDLAHLDLAPRGEAEPFDLAVLAGNVLGFVAPGTEADVLRRVAAHVRPDGAVVTGFHLNKVPLEVFDAAVAAAGLRLEHRFATWDLRAWHDQADFAVSVLRT